LLFGHHTHLSAVLLDTSGLETTSAFSLCDWCRRAPLRARPVCSTLWRAVQIYQVAALNPSHGSLAFSHVVHHVQAVAAPVFGKMQVYPHGDAAPSHSCADSSRSSSCRRTLWKAIRVKQPRRTKAETLTRNELSGFSAYRCD
jgi:hypothetical protein